MSNVAIRVDNLSKAYRISHLAQGQRSRYKTLQEEIVGLPGRAWQAVRGTGEEHETVWALRDVSFEVREGDVVGIIGRNGAGKSTLLKILSRITEPTSGQADLYGRVGSLLEVGTGFHPELTGRENVYLSGAVLGMRRSEIARRFDEIVEFSGVEQFIDTPVKRFSSGMYMRLAFSVAAHLEPEILIVDEVLAVGDAEFQKKSLGKMDDVAKSGRTVLFVSHNMAAVQQLCSRGIVLDSGALRFQGDVESAVQVYLALSQDATDNPLGDRRDRTGNRFLVFDRVRVLNSSGQELSTIVAGQDVIVRFHYRAQRELETAHVNVAFNVKNQRGSVLSNLNTADSGNSIMRVPCEGHFDCVWHSVPLRAGVYSCNLYCSINNEVADWLQDAFQLRVEDGDFYGTGRLPQRDQGDVLMDYSWSQSV
jgi:lipopolysaccharide transport system ATP-binding protein